MNTLILDFTDFTLICLIAIFFILVVTIYKVFQDVSFFDNKAASVVVSVCMALLSIIGMIRLFTPGNGVYVSSEGNVNENTSLDSLLFPYVVLGIFIIVIFLLKFFFDTYEKYYLRRFNKKYRQDIEKKHTSERNTVVWKKADEESRIRK